LPSTTNDPKLAKMKRKNYATPLVRSLALGVALLLPALGPACGGSSSGSSGFPTMGTPGMPSPARTGANLIFAEVDVDGQQGPYMLVDTGSPFTLIDPTDFPGVSFPSTAQVKVSLTFGTFTVSEVPALQTQFLTDGTFSLPPIVGGNLTSQFSTQLDYRGMQLRLGKGSDPSGVEAGSETPFDLRGGGTGSIDPAMKMFVHYPATRIFLTIDIEGTSYPAIVDSGASEVTVRQGLFDALVADGRAQQSGFTLSTAAGTMSGRVSRARSIAVGSETVDNPPILSLGDDGLFDSLAGELGHPVEALLGGTFLREFLVTIDYPDHSLKLQRYVPPSPVPDEFKRVGIEIHPVSGGGFTVSKVYDGSDAAQQKLAVGDVVLSIDGQTLAGMDVIAADLLLDGTVGTTKQVMMGTTNAPAIANQLLTLRVDDLLPAP
jgi:hypothetical protein